MANSADPNCAWPESWHKARKALEAVNASSPQKNSEKPEQKTFNPPPPPPPAFHQDVPHPPPPPPQDPFLYNPVAMYQPYCSYYNMPTYPTENPYRMNDPYNNYAPPPPPPPHQDFAQNERQNNENMQNDFNQNSHQETASPSYMKSPRNQGPYSQQNGSHPNFGNKQAPGSGGIRFQIPKRRNVGMVQQNNQGAGPGIRFNHPRMNPYQQQGTRDNTQSKHSELQNQQKKESPQKDNLRNAGSKNSDTTSRAMNNEDWPPSLKDYVQRAFSCATTEVQKDKLESFLKEKLTKVFNEGSTWSVDWSKEPIPNFGNRDTSFQPNSRQNKMDKSRPFGGMRGRGGRRGLGRGIYSNNRVPTYRLRDSRSRTRSRSRSWSRSRSKSWSRSRSRSRSRSNSRSRSRSPNKRRRRQSRRRSNSLSPVDMGRIRERRKSERGQARGQTRGMGRGRGGRGRGRGKNAQRETLRNESPAPTAAKKNKKSPKTQYKMEFDDPMKQVRMDERAARFGLEKTPRQKLTLTINNFTNNDDPEEQDLSSFRVVGSCPDMEKRYLRLTTAPDASTIRPLFILKKSLKMVQEDWKEKEDYRYACEQLKSIRQDLTCDHEEFNQCQTQLKLLYHEGLGGNILEFTAYRILYYIFTSNSLDMTTVLSSLSFDHRKHVCIKHALEVRSAWALNNYHSFFKLYRSAPSMSTYMMDWFVERVRKIALKSLIKSYRPMLPLEFFKKELGFEQMDAVLEFLKDTGVVFSADRTKIDCKASNAAVQAL
ncbi:leukocyte receptor cluster member 8 homolog [Gigantopelta aegis]|uniref:leukocyte receptor cluster member 8 homolog n=1 Tax=Gigantopelta aegis TaxID=1735272 RepID=UPI001B88CD87|nr:leukocyte receptor cluster member 8 homolog [Gigantopelta aegis]